MIDSINSENKGFLETFYLTQKKVLNIEEVARYTGLSKSYLYKLTCSGGIPCYKPNGKQIYFDRLELENWLLQNRKATNSEIETNAITYEALKNGGTKC